ncbi:MAG: ribonuclease J [bacterium]|nr:ribonuclease J [bacterium]
MPQQPTTPGQSRPSSSKPHAENQSRHRRRGRRSDNRRHARPLTHAATDAAAPQRPPKPPHVRDHEERRPPSQRSARELRRRMRTPRRRPVIEENGQWTVSLPPSEHLRIIPIGGLGEIGKNMTLIEYQGRILIVDVGFRFPEEDMPGVDYIIPNIEYLKGKEDAIDGILLTHGHMDHIGALPYVIEKLKYPTIYAAPLTAGLIKKRHEEFKNLAPLDIELITRDSHLKLGPFAIDVLHINHNIPDAVALAIATPVGTIIHTGDFKIDPDPFIDKPADLEKIKMIGDRGVLALLSDSTSADQEGHSLSERTIYENLEKIVSSAHGRIIAATFSSLINRVQQLIEIAEKQGRRIFLQGFSMRTNVEIARQLGYIRYKDSTMITDPEDLRRLPPEQIIVLGTGAQGEENAMLMRIASGEHRHVKIEKGDTVIFSSSVIPGNERSVQMVKDLLAKQGATIMHYQMMDVHAGGHGRKDDLRQMIQLVRPKYLIPVHGNFYMLKGHGEIGMAEGIPEKNVLLMENGQVAEFNAAGEARLLKQKVPAYYVMVDGLGIGDIREVVLRDRKTLASDGMFVIIAIVDSKSGKLRGSPDIITRGFVYIKESGKLIDDARKKVKEIIQKAEGPRHAVNWAYIKENLKERIGEFLFIKTERRPMILPVIIEV